jgi:hypothetical protein
MTAVLRRPPTKLLSLVDVTGSLVVFGIAYSRICI